MGKHSWQSKDDGAVQYFVPGHLPAKFAGNLSMQTVDSAKKS